MININNSIDESKAQLELETLMKIENVSKKFCVNLKRSMYYGLLDVGRNMLGLPYNTGKLRKDEFWALRNVSFELKKGETLGIIGANGSGKSTLLRLITGIFPPDEGVIGFKGRVGALIAVGAGFHPHMTGRENIYLNGTILGMSRKELDEKFDDIVEFSEIGSFLEAPVSTYSSGMRVRLGFSIAVHSEPDILLVDEVLSVGDLAFRNKSMRKMAEFREKANALIFVSHNLEQVRVLCEKILILDQGSIVYSGPTHQGIVQYEERSREVRVNNIKNAKNNSAIIWEKCESDPSDNIEVHNLGICDADNNKTDVIEMNSPLLIYCEFSCNIKVQELYFSIGVLNEQYKSCIWVVSNDNNKEVFKGIEKGKYRLLIKIPNHHLAPGVYIPNVAIRNGDTGETYERILPDLSFRVKSDGLQLERGIVQVDEEWILLHL